MLGVSTKIQVVSCINQDCLDDLRRLLHQDYWRVFELDGESIFDKTSLFAKSSDQLPHEQGLAAPHTWDTWIDILIGGLADLDGAYVAFLWTDAHRMLERGLPDLLVAVDCFRHVASEVARAIYGSPRPMLLKVFLVGKGDNFKSIDETLQQ